MALLAVSERTYEIASSAGCVFVGSGIWGESKASGRVSALRNILSTHSGLMRYRMFFGDDYLTLIQWLAAAMAVITHTS